MRTLVLIRFVSSAVTAAFALSACGGDATQQLAPAGAMPLGVPALHAVALGSHPLRPNPCCVQTLFVTDGAANQVQLFKFPQGTYLGQLAQPPEGFNGVDAECVDATNPQHVFIPNQSMSTIDEYTHDGSYVMHLDDPAGFPTSCAFRSTGTNSGFLAVGNFYNSNFIGGSVSVYKFNAGVWSVPTTYYPSNDPSVYYMDYKNDTLFLDVMYGGTFGLLKMSAIGHFTPITLYGSACPCTISVPSGIQHIGSYIAVGNRQPLPGDPNIYHMMPSGQVVGTTTLNPQPADLIQFYRNGAYLVAPDYIGQNADIFTYATGHLYQSITSPLVRPSGSAVSHQ